MVVIDENRLTQSLLRKLSEGMNLVGTIESIEAWEAALVDAFDAKCKHRAPEGQALETRAYLVPIMGRPDSSKAVCLKVEIDRRTGIGVLRIESGMELLLWQAQTQSLCNSCVHGMPWGKYIVCRDLVTLDLMQAPGERKRQCARYKFSGR